MSTMTVTAWKSGKHASTGTSYGFRVRPSDRNKYFDKSWETVIVTLPTGTKVQVNVKKKSFWNKCPELINKEIRDWLYETKNIPWKDNHPPQFKMTSRGSGKFVIMEPCQK